MNVYRMASNLLFKLIRDLKIDEEDVMYNCQFYASSSMLLCYEIFDQLFTVFLLLSFSS